MDRRVLSIQSHVVSGYVGNKAATFPLQVLGYDVDGINTVQYTNHSGYRRFGGTKTTASDIDKLLTTMRLNGMIDYTRLLTGFIPDAAALHAVAQVAEELRNKEPNKLTFIYVLDPVMGDEGQMYVSPDVLPIYRDVLLPLATIITPNWYEAELLTGIEIRDVMTLRAALTILHSKYGVPYVVISSLPLHTQLESQLHATGQLPESVFQKDDTVYTSDRLLCIASTSRPSPDESRAVSEVGVAVFPRIKGYFSGVGDLFSALILAHFTPHHNRLSSEKLEGSDESVAADIQGAASRPAVSSNALLAAVEGALATTQAILLSTHKYSASSGDCPTTDDEKDTAEPDRRVRRMRARELRIVQGMDVIQTPPRGLVAVRPWKGFWSATGTAALE